MLSVAARSIEFRGCSFSSAVDRPPAAIAWKSAGGELRFVDCVFSGVAAVVECRQSAAPAVEVSNSLCVAAGPIMRLRHAPRTGEATTITLERVTMRGDSAILECRGADEQPGTIQITANDCVLDTNPRGGLLVLGGTERPDRLLKAIAWSGQGSLVTPARRSHCGEADRSGRSSSAKMNWKSAGWWRSQVEFEGAV